MTMERKHLSTIANNVLLICSQKLDTSVDALVKEFEAEWKPEQSEYSRRLVEYVCLKALAEICCSIEENINNGSFSRLTFDMMLAWEMPSSADEESRMESVGKAREDQKTLTTASEGQDDIPLFYSDIMPLLVDHGPSIGEDSFVWLASLVPLAADLVNGRFSFETLTAPTGNCLHFPAYDMLLKEIDKCIKHLQSQETPKGVELADDEFILHVEGTATTQRVVRRIGGTKWPGRLTLTNYALYFEAFGVVSYEDALKLDLSKDIDQNVKPTATGPWGAPLYDKAIAYESSELQEPIELEFPEKTSSTRRDHWLALIKEVILLHKFLSKFKLDSPTEIWEMHSRTILGIVRLHAAREMLRISPPAPKNFLIFALFDEFPKGDYVLQELSESLKTVNSAHPCSASSILRDLNVSQAGVSSVNTKEASQAGDNVQPENMSTLESTINQVREEAKEIHEAKASTEDLEEEGITDSALVLMELLKPLKSELLWFQEVLTWERPVTTAIVTAITLLVTYKEWVGKAISAFLLWMAAKMLHARIADKKPKNVKIVVSTVSDTTMVDNIVSTQHGLRTIHDMMRLANISILKVYSIVIARAPKHANMVMTAMVVLAIVLAVVPIKFILMALTLSFFVATSKSKGTKKGLDNGRGNRRLKQWWNSIPVIPVEIER